MNVLQSTENYSKPSYIVIVIVTSDKLAPAAAGCVYLSPYFYTDNVKISLKRTDRLGIYKKKQFSSESLKGPASIALPSAGDAY